MNEQLINEISMTEEINEIPTNENFITPERKSSKHDFSTNRMEQLLAIHNCSATGDNFEKKQQMIEEYNEKYNDPFCMSKTGIIGLAFLESGHFFLDPNIQKMFAFNDILSDLLKPGIDQLTTTLINISKSEAQDAKKWLFDLTDCLSQNEIHCFFKTDFLRTISEKSSEISTLLQKYESEFANSEFVKNLLEDLNSFNNGSDTMQYLGYITIAAACCFFVKRYYSFQQKRTIEMRHIAEEMEHDIGISSELGNHYTESESSITINAVMLTAFNFITGFCSNFITDKIFDQLDLLNMENENLKSIEMRMSAKGALYFTIYFTFVAMIRYASTNYIHPQYKEYREKIKNTQKVIIHSHLPIKQISDWQKYLYYYQKLKHFQNKYDVYQYGLIPNFILDWIRIKDCNVNHSVVNKSQEEQPKISDFNTENLYNTERENINSCCRFLDILYNKVADCLWNCIGPRKNNSRENNRSRW